MTCDLSLSGMVLLELSRSQTSEQNLVMASLFSLLLLLVQTES